MRVFARFIVILVLVVGLAAFGLFVMREAIVEAAVRRVLANAGVENPSAALAEISLSHLVLAEATGGERREAADFRFAGVELRYDWREFFFGGRARSISIDRGTVALSIAEDGAVSVAGWTPPERRESGPPPVEAISIDRLAIEAGTPKGLARFVLAGSFDLEQGGRFRLRMEAPRASLHSVSIAHARGAATLLLKSGGGIEADGAIDGDLILPAGAARGIDAGFAASLASWRDLITGAGTGLSGSVRLAVNSSSVDAASSPALARFGEAGTPLGDLSLSGAIRAKIEPRRIEVSFDRPVSIVAERGDRLALSDGEGPLYVNDGAMMQISLAADLDAAFAKGTGSITAARSGAEPWTLSANALFAEQSFAGVSVEKFGATFAGTAAGSEIAGDLDVKTLLRSVSVGSVSLSEAPVAAELTLAADFGEERLTLSPREDRCVDFERASFNLAENSDARIANAALCAGESLLVLVDWSEEAILRAAGVLAAKSGRLRIGSTVFDGAPPTVNFTAEYRHQDRRTQFEGRFSQGSMKLNEAFVLSQSAGDIRATFGGEAITANAAIDALRIAQAAEVETVAPVAAKGSVDLADNQARFAFNIVTPSGVLIGKGEGRHAVDSGRGGATFASQALVFKPGGLQPQILVPALLGIVIEATGMAAGEVRYKWSPAGVDSEGDFRLDNLSFGGPGVVVTRTEGLTGSASLTDLSPLATEGPQTISIRKIDLDALKLENGTVRFELPGNETLKVIDAVFPWFGGRIGAYDAVVPLRGGAAETRLAIDQVDLRQLLANLDIEGLSGTGTIEGVLPLSIEDGKARIDHGVLSATGPGVIRYQGKGAAAAAGANEQAALAFEILRELRFQKLTVTIDGPLDGTLDFAIAMEGFSDLPVSVGGSKQRVTSPVIYNVTIEAPLLALLEQARITSDFQLQLERGAAPESEPD